MLSSLVVTFGGPVTWVQLLIFCQTLHVNIISLSSFTFSDDNLSFSSQDWSLGAASPTPSIQELPSLPILSASTSTPKSQTVTSSPNLSSGASINTSPSDMESSSTSSPAVVPARTMSSVASAPSLSSVATAGTLESGNQSITTGKIVVIIIKPYS